jgi:rhomboid protease GluP
MGQPRLTYVLLAVNILVFLAMTAAGGSTNTDVLIRFGAKANVLIAQGQVWRLLTSMFLHIGVMHLVFNSYALFILGVEVERLYGSARFLAIYLLAGLWGSLVSFALGPSLSAGASGAIFGLLGATAAFFHTHRRLGIVGLNLFLGFTVPGIDNLAHLGGLVSGAILGWVLAPQYRVHGDDRGRPHVVDVSSLLARWWAVALAAILLAGGIGVSVTVQRQSAPVLIHRGQIALDRDDPVAAESLFRQAVARDSRSTEAYFYLGNALSAQERPVEAAPAYQTALRLQPDLAEAHWNLALAYMALNRPADAIAEFEAFISLRPASPGADQARTFIAKLEAADR